MILKVTYRTQYNFLVVMKRIMLVPALVQFLRLENIRFLKLPLAGTLICDDTIKHILFVFTFRVFSDPLVSAYVNFLEEGINKAKTCQEA